MTRELLVFDVCAAPFGTAYFYSCRFAELPSQIKLWQLAVLLIGLVGSFALFAWVASFLGMNWTSHVDAHWEYFSNLTKGDDDSTDKHRKFYDEYLSVLDLTEEFYLQTIRDVFQEHLIPRGLFMHRGHKVRAESIRNVALMTVEGEHDDISGIGQTQAAHDICSNIPVAMRIDHLQEGVGHYGVFNGRRFRTEIYPRMREFIRTHQTVRALTRRVTRVKADAA